MRAQTVTNKICEWVGCVQGDSTHKHILDIYNSYIKSGKAPYASRHLMTPADAWCAATVSAAFIDVGYGEDFGCIECSCGRMIELLKKKGLWEESDAAVPEKGWLIFYDWSDTGIGDDSTGHDHVGLVVECKDGIITVVEGNKGSSHVCGIRTIKVNGRYIRGFGQIKYDGQTNTYTVVKGDNLTKIGKKVGVPWREIAQLNGLSAPYTIYPGQILRIR